MVLSDYQVLKGSLGLFCGEQCIRDNSGGSATTVAIV